MTATQLPNGKYVIRDLASGLQGVYNAEGMYSSGDLRLTRIAALAVILDVPQHRIRLGETTA